MEKSVVSSLVISLVSLIVAAAALVYGVVVPGPQGAKGDTGPQGPTGATGPTGPQGPPGIENVALIHTNVVCNIGDCTGLTFDLFVDTLQVFNDAGGGFNPFNLVVTWNTAGTKTVTVRLESSSGFSTQESRTLSNGVTSLLQISWQ